MNPLALLVSLAFGFAAGAASLPPTGPHLVRHVVLKVQPAQSGRPIHIEVWLPAGRLGGRFPLLLFSPGFGGTPVDYSSQLEDLASHGYVVAGLDHAADLLDAFEPRAALWAQDLLAAKQMLLRSPLRGRIDANRIGAFGHSHGGRSAAAACLLDSAIRACLNQDGRLDDIRLLRPYWPIPGRQFAGTFALLDWFDPGLDDGEFRSMKTTRERYALGRLPPSAAALEAYRAPHGGSYRITLLSSGMQHTAFTDTPWSQATSDSERARYAGYLRQIRAATLAFFNRAFQKNAPSTSCGGTEDGVLTQCFAPTLH